MTITEATAVLQARNATWRALHGLPADICTHCRGAGETAAGRRCDYCTGTGRYRCACPNGGTR